MVFLPFLCVLFTIIVPTQTQTYLYPGSISPLPAACRQTIINKQAFSNNPTVSYATGSSSANLKPQQSSTIVLSGKKFTFSGTVLSPSYTGSRPGKPTPYHFTSASLLPSTSILPKSWAPPNLLVEGQLLFPNTSYTCPGFSNTACNFQTPQTGLKCYREALPPQFLALPSQHDLASTRYWIACSTLDRPYIYTPDNTPSSINTVCSTIANTWQQSSNNVAIVVLPDAQRSITYGTFTSVLSGGTAVQPFQPPVDMSAYQTSLVDYHSYFLEYPSFGRLAHFMLSNYYPIIHGISLSQLRVYGPLTSIVQPSAVYYADQLYKMTPSISINQSLTLTGAYLLYSDLPIVFLHHKFYNKFDISMESKRLTSPTNYPGLFYRTTLESNPTLNFDSMLLSLKLNSVSSYPRKHLAINAASIPVGNATNFVDLIPPCASSAYAAQSFLRTELFSKLAVSLSGKSLTATTNIKDTVSYYLQSVTTYFQVLGQPLSQGSGVVGSMTLDICQSGHPSRKYLMTKPGYAYMWTEANKGRCDHSIMLTSYQYPKPVDATFHATTGTWSTITIPLIEIYNTANPAVPPTQPTSSLPETHPYLTCSSLLSPLVYSDKPAVLSPFLDPLASQIPTYNSPDLKLSSLQISGIFLAMVNPQGYSTLPSIDHYRFLNQINQFCQHTSSQQGLSSSAYVLCSTFGLGVREFSFGTVQQLKHIEPLFYLAINPTLTPSLDRLIFHTGSISTSKIDPVYPVPSIYFSTLLNVHVRIYLPYDDYITSSIDIPSGVTVHGYFSFPYTSLTNIVCITTLNAYNSFRLGRYFVSCGPNVASFHNNATDPYQIPSNFTVNVFGIFDSQYGFYSIPTSVHPPLTSTQFYLGMVDHIFVAYTGVLQPTTNPPIVVEAPQLPLDIPTVTARFMSLPNNSQLHQDISTGSLVDFSTGSVLTPIGTMHSVSYSIPLILRFAVPINTFPHESLNPPSCAFFICAENPTCISEVQPYCQAADYSLQSFTLAKKTLITELLRFNTTAQILAPQTYFEFESPTRFGETSTDGEFPSFQSTSKLPETSSAFQFNNPSDWFDFETGNLIGSSSVRNPPPFKDKPFISSSFKNFRVTSDKVKDLNINIKSTSGKIAKGSKLGAISGFIGGGLSIVDMGLSIFTLINQFTVEDLVQTQISELADGLVLLADSTFEAIHRIEVAINELGTFINQLVYNIGTNLNNLSLAFGELETQLNKAIYYTTASQTYVSSINALTTSVSSVAFDVREATATLTSCIESSMQGFISKDCVLPDVLLSMRAHVNNITSPTGCQFIFPSSDIGNMYSLPLVTSVITSNSTVSITFDLPVTCDLVNGDVYSVHPGIHVNANPKKPSAVKVVAPDHIVKTPLGIFALKYDLCSIFGHLFLCQSSALSTEPDPFVSSLVDPSVRVPTMLTPVPDPCYYLSVSTVYCYYSPLCNQCLVTSACNETINIQAPSLNNGTLNYTIHDPMCTNYAQISTSFPISFDDNGFIFSEFPKFPIHVSPINVTYNQTFPPNYSWDNISYTQNWTGVFSEMRQNITVLAEEIANLNDWGRRFAEGINHFLSSIFNIPLGLLTFILALSGLVISVLTLLIVTCSGTTTTKLK